MSRASQTTVMSRSGQTINPSAALPTRWVAREHVIERDRSRTAAAAAASSSGVDTVTVSPMRQNRIGDCAAANKVEVAYVPFNAALAAGQGYESSAARNCSAVQFERRGRQPVAADTGGRPRGGAGIERRRPRRDHQCTDRAPDQTSAVAHRVLLDAHGAACASGKRCGKKAEVTTAGGAHAVRHVEQKCVMWSSTLDWWRRGRA